MTTAIKTNEVEQTLDIISEIFRAELPCSCRDVVSYEAIIGHCGAIDVLRVHDYWKQVEAIANNLHGVPGVECKLSPTDVEGCRELLVTLYVDRREVPTVDQIQDAEHAEELVVDAMSAIDGLYSVIGRVAPSAENLVDIVSDTLHDIYREVAKVSDPKMTWKSVETSDPATIQPTTHLYPSWDSACEAIDAARKADQAAGKPGTRFTLSIDAETDCYVLTVG